jgi:hypothetical protein
MDELNPMFADLPLRKAALHVAEGDTFWTQTMPTVLARYPQITPQAYWELTVAEHAELTAHE